MMRRGRWALAVTMAVLVAVSGYAAPAHDSSATTVVHHAKKAVHSAAVKVATPVKAAAKPVKKAVAAKAVPVKKAVSKVAAKKAVVEKKVVAEKAAKIGVKEAAPVKTVRHPDAKAAAVTTAATVADKAAVQAVADEPVDTSGGPSTPLVKDGDPVVREIQAKQRGKSTQVWLALTNGANYRWFTLPQPARLVVDFTPEVKFDAEPGGVNYPSGSQVQAIRAGRFRPGTVRMVMDLKNPSKLTVAMLPAQGGNGPRLLINVAPPTGSQQATNVPPPSDVVTAAQGTAPDVAAAADEVVGQNSQASQAPVQIEAPKKNGKPVLEEDQATAAPMLPVRPVARSKTGTAAPIVVTIDPGHGGVDPGTHGRSFGTLEKNLTLSMAKQVREDLLATWGDDLPPLKIVMTRDSDVYIPLPDRVKIAQRANADLFVSLHADSAPSSDVTGATVYMVSDRGSDRESRRLAAQENSGDAVAGIPLENESKEVQTILVSLVQRDTMNNSTYLGQNILKNVGDTTAVRKRNLMYAGFRVLEAADVPSVLVEMGYLSNPREEEALASPEHQKELAAAIAKGVTAYIKQYVHH